MSENWIEETNDQGEVTIKKDTQNESKQKLYENYERIIDFNKSYMDLPEDTHKIIAIWIMGTYFHEQFNTYPYLFLNAMRGSGKTRQLKIISHLGNLGDGTIQNDMSEAVLFRMKRNKVLCIDEFENIANKDKQVLRQLLNSAYKKGMKVTRMKKAKEKNEEKFIEENFEPFIPICMANINGMDEVLGDRSIKVVLEKSTNPRITKKAEDFEENPLIEDIKKELVWFSAVKCCSMASKNIIKKWNFYLEEKYNSNITTYNNNITYNNITTLTDEEIKFFNKLDEVGIDGRNFELCFPLLVVSKEISEGIFEEILNILKGIVRFKKDEEFSDSRDVSLYDFISQKESLRFDWVFLKALTNEFRTYMGEQDSLDNWINEKWLGNALIRLKLRINTKRMPQGRQIVLDIDKAKEMIKKFKSVEKENEIN